MQSRIIKFRAWLLKENKMVVVDTLSHNKGYGGALEIIIDNPKFNPVAKNWEGENRPSDSYLNHSMKIHKERNGGDDFILMQYTGLKDRNDKEIYEGDLVKHKIFGEAEDETPTSTETTTEVEFKYGKWNIIEWYFSPVEECEVIGNIYENADLLVSAL